MDARIATDQPAATSGFASTSSTSRGSDDIEEVVRPSELPLRHQLIYGHTALPRSVRPIRRRLRIDEYLQKSHRTFVATATMDSTDSMEGSEVSPSSAMAVVTSATSSCTDSWSPCGFVEEIEEDGTDMWEDQDQDDLLEPKIEPMDEMDLADLAEMKEGSARIPQMPPSPLNAQGKRPRGRPRKHPKPSPESLAKVTKGRSKTGCLTCRRRKKKCDEMKPSCMNCEKNSVKCEGYPEKQAWKSGKEKAEEGKVIQEFQQMTGGLTRAKARLRRASNPQVPSMPLPSIFLGVETEGDRIFFQHYVTRLSMIFTVEGEKESSFRRIILPVAQRDIGLMHSILSLSSKHIDFASPYGRQLLVDHPNIDIPTLEARSQFHHDEAVKELTSRSPGKKAEAVYCQILCLVLQTLSDPRPKGEHRFHLEHYQKLILEAPPGDAEFTKFIHEFFQYHICADEIVRLPKDAPSPRDPSNIWNLSNTVLQPDAVRLLGVFDGLFRYMAEISSIRYQIRNNLEQGVEPAVDYTSLYQAAEIDAGIREWKPAWVPGDKRDLPGKLYQHMMWVYLFRTIYPLRSAEWKPDPRIVTAVNDAITLLGMIGPRDSSQTLVLAPAFVIGCAAFEPEQREPIRKAIATVKSYMEYKNSDTALEVLEEVWRLMDLKDESSWDWQSIAHRMGLDFLAT